jgi:aromatic amino acid aminotransferase I / 2-aminoadipate transaminase
MPHPDYFPFSAIHVDALAMDSYSTEPSERPSTFSWLWNIFSSKKNITYTVPKYPTTLGDINLAAALQYDTSVGMVQLREFIREFTARVYQPAYSDWEVMCDTGNTDGQVLICNIMETSS